MKTITAYYKPLKDLYQTKLSASDEVTYAKNKDKLDLLAPYFKEHLAHTWDVFFRYKNPMLGSANHVDSPRLAAFVGFGLMDKMIFEIPGYNSLSSSIKELFILQNKELLYALIEEIDDGWNYNSQPGGGWYKGDNILSGESYPEEKKQRELHTKYYNLMIAEIGED